MYRKHPVGSLLVWATQADTAPSRGDGELAPGVVKLLLDGQQRITSLYGIIRGKPPEFFQGNQKAFTGLYFHLGDEVFAFYAPLKMKDNPMWVSVTEIMQEGAGDAIKKLVAQPEFTENLTKYINRITAIDQIKSIDLHVEEVTGQDKTIDIVVDIFNRVNSGGTKLSKGDLALATVCAGWPEARGEMRTRLEKWAEHGFSFKLDWLLRCINTVLTGEALFTALKKVNIPEFQNGLQLAEKYVDMLLNLIAARLGLDHDRVLGSRYSFPLLVRYLHQIDGDFSDNKAQDKLLYWYIHTFLWGRYAGSTESVLNQDLAVLEETDDPLDGLIQKLRSNRGDLKIHSDDFKGWSRSARFYPLLYMMTRVWHSKDWGSGIELKDWLLGKTSSLQIHHIFPKALLYKNGYTKAEVNAIANFTFLTQDTNLKISDRNPADYLEEYSLKHSGAIESHWIPMDRELWKIENYPQFLSARRALLSNAANEFLDSLYKGTVQKSPPLADITRQPHEGVPGGFATEDEEKIINECNDWVVQRGLPPGETLYELIEPYTQELMAILDLAWPDGLQVGLSQPVALLIDEEKATEEAVNAVGYRFFNDPQKLYEYIEREILAQVE